MKPFLLAVALVASIATAIHFIAPAEAAQPKLNPIQHVSPEAFNNLILNSRGYVEWDFPVLGAGAINCSDTAAIITPGCAFGDGCMAGTTTGMDGGATLSIEAELSCYVSAVNTTKVRVCAPRADAGTLDLPDSGYTAHCVH